LNLHFMIAKGEAPTADDMQALIERADRDKGGRAEDRLAVACEEER
jgi:hypothetical protein